MTRILLVGGGGREHALAWRLTRDDPALELIAAPGNPGISALGRCVPVAATDIDGLVALAQSEQVDAVFVGPEGPLALGLVDRLSGAGIAAFGPTAAAAMLETSKRFAKEVMPAFKGAKVLVAPEMGPMDSDVLLERLKTGPVSPATDGRIQRAP